MPDQTLKIQTSERQFSGGEMNGCASLPFSHSMDTQLS